MFQKILILPAYAAIALGVVACQKKASPLPPGALTPEQKVKLKANAVKAYEDLVKKYPDSPHAEPAKQRIDALQGPAK